MARLRNLTFLFCAIYLAATIYRASVKPLWYDEFFTYYISTQGSPAKIWSALRAGVDLNPPLIYATTWLFHSLLGTGHIPTRLPSILGFLLLLISVRRLAASRLPAPYAVQAMVFAGLTGAYSFAYEARAYGLLLGFSALALSCWQRRQPLATGAALAATLLTHCYAVAFLPALFVGEAVFTWRFRKIDKPIWLAIILPCTLIVTYIPLMHGTEIVELTGPIFDPTPYRLIASYLDLLLPALLPALLILGGIAIITRLAKLDTGGARNIFPAHEWAALAVLALSPAIAFTISNVVRGGYFTRYGLGASIPIAIGIAALSYRLAGSGWRPAALVPWVAAAWFTGSFLWQLNLPRPEVPARELAAWIAERDTPLVISDGQTFLELDHYLDPASAARLVFLTERGSALRYMRTDCYDTALRVVRPYFPIRGRLIPYDEFLAANPRFKIYGTTRPDHAWLPQRLAADGIPYRLRLTTQTKQLAEVRQ